MIDGELGDDGTMQSEVFVVLMAVSMMFAVISFASLAVATNRANQAEDILSATADGRKLLEGVDENDLPLVRVIIELVDEAKRVDLDPEHLVRVAIALVEGPDGLTPSELNPESIRLVIQLSRILGHADPQPLAQLLEVARALGPEPLEALLEQKPETIQLLIQIGKILDGEAASESWLEFVRVAQGLNLKALTELIEGNPGFVGEYKELKEHKLPPIDQDYNAETYSFVSGSAKMDGNFDIAKIAADVKQSAKDCGCDVVEVIGHTDGEVVVQKKDGPDSDSRLLHELQPGGEPWSIRHRSNVELGMLRAATVAVALKERLKGKGLTIRAYSAGETVLPESGQLASPRANQPDKERRRIEIRVRHSKKKLDAMK